MDTLSTTVHAALSQTANLNARTQNHLSPQSTLGGQIESINVPGCYDFSYFALFTYVFSLFLEVSHGAAALTHFSLTHITATLLTHCTAVVLTIA